jgi:hypothetical protein
MNIFRILSQFIMIVLTVRRELLMSALDVTIAIRAILKLRE